MLEQQRVADTNRLNRLIHKAIDVVGLEHVILDNGPHPFHDVVVSNWIQVQYNTDPTKMHHRALWEQLWHKQFPIGDQESISDSDSDSD